MDRINDKHIQEKGHRADCRKKQQGTRIKAALLAGLAGAVLANTFPGQIRNLAVQHREQAAVSAWWGTIYPQFCFMEAPRTEEGQKAEPRFHFWIVETLLFTKNTSWNVTSEP